MARYVGYWAGPDTAVVLWLHAGALHSIVYNGATVKQLGPIEWLEPISESIHIESRYIKPGSIQSYGQTLEPDTPECNGDNYGNCPKHPEVDLDGAKGKEVDNGVDLVV